jgi:hypothetical protein
MNTVPTPLQAIQQTQAQVAGMIPRRENLFGNRYGWFALDDIHHADISAMTNGVNGGKMRRLRWQPITRAPRWVHSGALGDNHADVVATRNPDGISGRPREEMYWIKPAAIMASLNVLYGNRGLVDSDVLRYAELDTFEALHLDEFFFPEADEDLPRTFRECEVRMVSQMQKLQSGDTTAPDGRTMTYSNAVIPSLVKIGEEMLNSLRASARVGRVAIDERHAEMEKAATDTTGRYRGTYDNRERRLLEWLEITPRNQALEKIALDSNQLPLVIQQMANVVAAQATRQPETLDVGALGAAIGASLAKELAPLMVKSEPVAEPASSEKSKDEPLALNLKSKNK